MAKLSSRQRQALELMSLGRFSRMRSGWGGWELRSPRYQTQTITALEQRGLCRIHARRFAMITAKGRRALEEAT